MKKASQKENGFRPWLLACGGTGGHMMPGIAVYQAYEREGLHPVLAISHKPIDRVILKDYPDYRWVKLNGVLWKGNPLKRLWALGCMGVRVLQAMHWLLKHKALGVIGFGGFNMVPWVLAAFLLRKRILLHESNAIPGKATSVLAKLADKVGVPKELHLKGMRCHPIGVPLREGFDRIAKELARRGLQLPDYGRVLLVMGGSQGAKALNDWVRQHMESLAQSGWHAVVLTGPNESAEERHTMGQAGERFLFRFIPFEKDMAKLFSAVDFAITRSGAGTLAELIHLQVPSILLPYPHAAGDHQTVNAQWLSGLGGAAWLPEAALDELWNKFVSLTQGAALH
jgi:UDP-N-acetylglucosamine--N-acetylmuramyl-(pentapeptide) pyrophosphoryl-undecaprenol N-acetylglucosamine transferase